MSKTFSLSVIGLGKLGSCMAAAYASRGHHVIGVDINESFVASLNRGEPPVPEKDLASCISSNRDKIRATTDYKMAISESEITFIIVPTPSENSGLFTARFVLAVCTQIGEALHKKEAYHTVVLTSTLLPGDCEDQVIPALEAASGKKCGKDFGFCYSPEFIAIGSVMHDLLNPDFFLVGESDERSGDVIQEFYSTILPSAPVRRMNIPSAELTKISVNSFLTMKITFGNMLAEVAEHIPGVNVDLVAEAVGSDRRIGKHYLRGGLGYGGPCFPRDNRAFAMMAKKRGVNVPYALVTDAYNSTIIDRSVAKIVENVSDGSSVGLIGLSYKPGTNFSEESQAIGIGRKLIGLGYKVHAYNPAGNDHARTLLGEEAIYHDDLTACVQASELLFLTNIDQANNPLPSLVVGTNKKIVDPWRQFKTQSFSSGIKYITFGIGPTK